MNRTVHSKPWLRIAILAALIVAPATLAAPAVAAAPATEEYVLEVPGINQADDVSIEATNERDTSPVAGQQGVVGEDEPPTSPLASGIAMAGSNPVALVILLAALIAAAIATGRRSSR